MQGYARDRIEAPLAELSNMLIDIEKNIFDPDSGDILSWHMESKRRARKSSSCASKASDCEEVSDSESSTSSSSSSSSNPDPHWEARRLLSELGPKTVLKDFCVHIGTKKVHKVKCSGEFTNCGRRLSGMYAQAEKVDEQSQSACLICLAEVRRMCSDSA